MRQPVTIDTLFGWALTALIVAGIAPNISASWLGVGLALGWAGLLWLLRLLPLDRRVLAIGSTACLMAAWVWATMLVRTPPKLPTSFTITGPITTLPEPSTASQRIDVRVQQSSAPVLVGKTVTVFARDASVLSPGQIVSATASPLGGSISHDIYLAQLAKDRAIVLKSGPLTLNDIDRSPQFWLLNLRSIIVNRSYKLWPSPESSLAAGLVVGSRESFSPSLTAAMQTTGTTHLVAVSGENVAVVLWVIGIFLPRKRPWIRLLVLAAAVILFAVLTGGAASVWRAGVMAMLLLLAAGLGRPVDSLRLLIIVAAALTILNPLAARADLGYQLSFLAVFGIITLARPIARLTHLPNGLATAVGTSVAATLVTAPVIAATFGTLSLISPAINVVLELIVNPTLVLSAVTVLVSLAVPIAGRIFAWLTYLPLTAITRTITYTAAVPHASAGVTLPVWTGWLITAVFIALGLLIEFRSRRQTVDKK